MLAQRGCDVVLSLVKQIREFDLNQDRPGDACENLVQRVKDHYDSVMEPLTLPLAFTATQATDYGKLEREAKGLYENIKADVAKTEAYLDDAREEAKQSLDALRKQVAEGGVSENAQHFSEAAKSHGDEAETWLRATKLAMTATVGAALLAVVAHFLYHPDSVARGVQFVVAKLIVLSVLTLIVLWCARNYRSHKHNETLNSHRAHALLTFRTFVEGTDDPRVKDAILLQAAQAAFAGRPTGYDGAEQDGQQVSPIVEVMGKAMPTGDGGTG